MELDAHRSYTEANYPISYWRTKSGLEVDFVLGGGEVAIEVKGTERVANKMLRGLNAFAEEFRPRHALMVCNEREERLAGQARVMPWRRFLTSLWAGDYLP